MLQINELDIINEKRILIRVPDLILAESSINALIGEEKSGKSLLARTIHGLYPNYRGIIDFHNLSKRKPDSYLLTKEVHLLQEKTTNENLAYMSKDHQESISEYSLLAELENDLERTITELPYYKQKLVELAIACGINPILLIIDDFDKCFTNLNLIQAGKMLSTFKNHGGSVLLTSNLKIPDMDSIYIINDGSVVKL